VAETPPAGSDIPVAPAEAPRPSSILALQVGVVVVAALYFARDVLIPITLAVLLSFVLAPLVQLLDRAGLRRPPAVILAVLVALGLISAYGGIVGSQVAQLADNIPQYAATIEKKIDTVREYTIGRITSLVHRLDHAAAPATGAPGHAANNPAPAAGTNGAAAPAAAANQSDNTPIALIQRYLSPALSPLATLGIVFVVAIFILLQKEDLRDRLIRLFGTTDLHRTTVALDDAAHRLSRYFLTQLAINASFGAVVGIGLYLIGVPNPVLWAMLSALLRFVPYIGAYISAALPIALAAAVSPGWSMAIWTAILYISVELIVGQAVEPVAYGHSTGLSPLAVVVAAIFWSWLWGPIGLILSMPLTLCLVVLGRHVDRLQFLDVLLGDRPALTPVESFYQRILAGDADEAQSQAESLLKDQPLSAYYDSVVLKGLQLAAIDARRGALKRDQLERVKETIGDLLTEVAVYDDRDGEAPAGAAAAPARGEAAASAEDDAPAAAATVLCLAGNGPLDETVSEMLAQLLSKHGLAPRIVPYGAASRDRIAALDVSGVAIICVSYLDISGTPSHLRYLIQRLRRKSRSGLIVVGLWPSDDPILQQADIRAAMGADHYTTSLRETVSLCVQAARLPASAETPAKAAEAVA